MNNWFLGYGHKKIYKGKDGRWRFDFTCNGRRLRKIVGLSRTEAEEAMWQEYQKSKRLTFGLKEPIKNVCFETFAQDFLRLYAKQNKKSWGRDEISLKHLTAFFKNALLSNITPEAIEQYRVKRKAGDISPATINRELACLKTLFNKAVEWGKIENNPAVHVKKFKENNGRERFLTDDEMNRLVETASLNLKPILTIAMNTGMRKAEILSLQWKSINFQDRYISIEDSKSGKSRNIPMNDLVFETFRTMPKVHEFVFYNRKTKGYIKDIKTAFKTACKRAKIKGFRFHDLRHSAASAMVRNGIDLVTVSKILGHSSIQMTMRYAHPTPENMQRAVDSLGSIFLKSAEEKQEILGKNLGSQQIRGFLNHSFLNN